MSNVHFTTLAALRMQDPVTFDATIAKAVRETALKVGLNRFAEALTRQERCAERVTPLKRAA